MSGLVSFYLSGRPQCQRTFAAMEDTANYMIAEDGSNSSLASYVCWVFLILQASCLLTLSLSCDLSAKDYISQIPLLRDAPTKLWPVGVSRV